MRERLVVGCMTGTSLDGLDVALVRIRGTGLAMSVEIVGTGSRPLPDRNDSDAVLIHYLADGGPCDTEQIAKAAHWFSLFHADVVEQVLATAGLGRPDLVSVHGQTVFHRPPLSWQLFNPWPLAHRVNAPVVFDLRGADLAAGGQGAPITPLADWVMFRTTLHPVVAVNLGGYCNITYLPATSPGHEASELRAIRARDVCACNHVLDAVARSELGVPYDENGAAAARGTSQEDALVDLLERLGAQSASGRSLGSGDEARAWIEAWRGRTAPDDLAATAAEGVGISIARAVLEHDGALAVVAGGGAKNRVLLGHIESLAPIARMGDGVNPLLEYREAAAMAVLGALCQDRVPITLPQVTGVRAPAPVAGSWAGV